MEILELFSTYIWKVDPWWFPLLEAFGILVGVIAYAYVMRIRRQMRGGTIDRALQATQMSVGFLIAGLVLRLIFEIQGFEGFAFEFIFEAMIYVAMGLIALSTKRFASMGNA